MSKYITEQTFGGREAYVGAPVVMAVPCADDPKVVDHLRAEHVLSVGAEVEDKPDFPGAYSEYAFVATSTIAEIEALPPRTWTWPIEPKAEGAQRAIRIESNLDEPVRAFGGAEMLRALSSSEKLTSGGDMHDLLVERAAPGQTAEETLAYVLDLFGAESGESVAELGGRVKRERAALDQLAAFIAGAWKGGWLAEKPDDVVKHVNDRLRAIGFREFHTAPVPAGE